MPVFKRPVPSLSESDLEQFISCISIEEIERPNLIGPCWLWTGPLHSNKYGNFAVHCEGGKKKYTYHLAHRISFTIWKGPIPDGLEPDHLCRVRKCISPDHLEAVTHKVNMSRRFWTLKTTCSKGHLLTDNHKVARKSGPRKGRIYRYCAICNAEHTRLYKQRKKKGGSQQVRTALAQFTVDGLFYT